MLLSLQNVCYTNVITDEHGTVMRVQKGCRPKSQCNVDMFAKPGGVCTACTPDTCTPCPNNNCARTCTSCSHNDSSCLPTQGMQICFADAGCDSSALLWLMPAQTMWMNIIYLTCMQAQLYERQSTIALVWRRPLRPQ